ncbi:MAG: bifunctional precorrin-2 dehydrogenase/sirohydrochlorin ferrochelatase [Tissierellia bacterium]|nr:bifunctional precorrin-2 dehydrogenase/sirohydrochlorin ferrochelatase [Tissierellia bacterium]
MKYFPISVDTEDKKILILGGGKVATRKVKTLLDTKFEIYVIGATFEEELLELSKDYPERVKLKGSFVNRDFVFMGYDYVIIATNDTHLNDHLEETAIQRSIPYVRCDHRSKSSFIMNKVLTQGDITVSISAGGNNPTVAELVAKDLELTLSRINPDKIKILNQIREALVRKNTPNVKEIIEDLYYKEIFTLNTYLEELHEDKTGDQGEQPGSDTNDNDKDTVGENPSSSGSGNQNHKNEG